MWMRFVVMGLRSGAEGRRADLGQHETLKQVAKVDRVAESIPYRPYLNRDRLIYLTHSDAKVAKGLCDEFIAQGFKSPWSPILRR